MNSKKFLFISVIAIAILVTFFLLSNENKFVKQNLVSEKPTGGDFTLSAFDRKHTLKEYQGKLVLLYFGYTYCPDICPTDLGNLSITYRNLSQAEKDQIQILFVTVDPERDTATRLQEYTNYFAADMVGLTGSKEAIATVAKQYGVVYAKAKQEKPTENYSVDHSAFTYLIDRQGQLQTQLPHAAPPEQIKQLIQTYLSK